MSDSNLLEIYQGIEKSLLTMSTSKKQSSDLLQRLDQTVVLEEDQDYYRALVTAIFHGSGIKAVQLEPVLTKMFNGPLFSDYKKVRKLTEKQKQNLCRPHNIGYKQSLERVFKSTQVFVEKIKQHGSFLHYMNFLVKRDALYKELKKDFHGLGERSTYHFLKECGHPHIKPDSVIGRIFSRLDLIADSNNVEEILECGDKIAAISGYTHQRIDLVLVKFGAEGASDIFNLVDGICRETEPDCINCFVKDHCSFTTTMQPAH